MKYFRNVLSIVVAFGVLLYFGNQNVYAFSSGYKTETLSSEELNRFKLNYNFEIVDSISMDEFNKPFICFSVNDYGVVAIGYLSHTNEGYVLILQEDEVLGAYRFRCNGSFILELEKDCINIFNVRSSIIAKYTLSGEFVDAAKVIETEENNSYSNQLRDKTSYSINGSEYVGIRSKFSYSKLKVVQQNGIELIIIDAQQFGEEALTIGLAISAIFILKTLTRYHRKK